MWLSCIYIDQTASGFVFLLGYILSFLFLKVIIRAAQH
jgi:hypothetical protein